ncbi:MAG: hypothetical protein KF876_16685 [Nitrospira sp.]|nr:hypothetical protein [Nitrospira sp.]MDR4463452.1 hypothetical protein [Nitrospira sp.]MDR4470459.1 hypothetical protein [Nitrospira sp.]
MTNRSNKKRACVMIVQQDLHHGIKLADWLATNGYQAVLVRSVEHAIDECRELNPQAVFIDLGCSHSAAPINVRRLLLTIERLCPGISVITMGPRPSNNPIQAVTGGRIRHVLVAPIDLADIGHLLQAELNRASPSTKLPSPVLPRIREWPAEHFRHEQASQKKAARWIR